MKDMVWSETFRRWMLANGRTVTVCLLAASLLNALDAFERTSLILIGVTAAFTGATCLAFLIEGRRRAAEEADAYAAEAAREAAREEEAAIEWRDELNDKLTD